MCLHLLAKHGIVCAASLVLQNDSIVFYRLYRCFARHSEIRDNRENKLKHSWNAHSVAYRGLDPGHSPKTPFNFLQPLRLKPRSPAARPCPQRPAAPHTHQCAGARRARAPPPTAPCARAATVCLVRAPAHPATEPARCVYQAGLLTPSSQPWCRAVNKQRKRPPANYPE